MPFLPPEAQDRLLDNITVLSAAGSRLATENLADAGRAVPMMAARMRAVTDRWREHGFDVEMTDLWYPGDRTEVLEYLGARGWQTAATRTAELLAAHGLSLQTDDEEEAAMLASRAYVTAIRT